MSRHPQQGVGEGVLEALRLLAHVPRHAVEAREARKGHPVCAQVAQGAVEPGGPDRDQHYPGIDLAKAVVAQAQLLYDSRRPVLAYYVHPLHQPQGQLSRLGLFQVQGDAAVARPAGVVLQAAVGVLNALGEWGQKTVDVYLLARLDLVHLGPEKGQGLPEDRPQPHGAEVEHLHALQR